jgi:hypothetical protein
VAPDRAADEPGGGIEMSDVPTAAMEIVMTQTDAITLPELAETMAEEATNTIKIKQRWSARIIFECAMTAEVSVLDFGARLGFAVKKAFEGGADLRGADLGGANLRDANLRGANLRDADLVGANLGGAHLRDANLGGADLRDADLRSADLRSADLRGANLGGANLRDADLRGADLRGANLGGADLRDADLVGANLRGANLRDADLGGADLSVIRNDLFDVLLRSRHEVPGLLLALREGRIDGSTYSGECACLCGTIANVRGVNHHTLGFVDASRPIERWFLNIGKGDKPETSLVAKITEGWIEEFQRFISDVVSDDPAAIAPG